MIFLKKSYLVSLNLVYKHNVSTDIQFLRKYSSHYCRIYAPIFKVFINKSSKTASVGQFIR